MFRKMVAHTHISQLIVCIPTNNPKDFKVCLVSKNQQHTSTVVPMIHFIVANDLRGISCCSVCSPKYYIILYKAFVDLSNFTVTSCSSKIKLMAQLPMYLKKTESNGIYLLLTFI